MRLDPNTRLGSLGMTLAAGLARAFFAVLSATWRFDDAGSKERVETLLTAGRPAILSFWHDRSLIGACFLRRALIRRGFAVTLLASQSRDGELAARIARGWQVSQVRGSATRGGREAMRLVYRAIVRDGCSPVMVPDGPHGPPYEFKLGVVVLAQLSKAPIQPLGFAADRTWRLRSWDRLIVPKPFARLTVVAGEPRLVAREQEGDALEAERRRLQELLSDVTDRAEAALSGSLQAVRRAPNL